MFIDMEKCLIKQKMKVLAFIFLISIISHYPKAYALDNIEIMSVKSVEYRPERSYEGTGFDKQCKAWHLTKQQIKRIFHLSEETTYIGLTEYADFPCEIEGKLKFEGKIVNYSINAGFFSVIWKNGQDDLFYACAKKECKKFFLN